MALYSKTIIKSQNFTIRKTNLIYHISLYKFIVESSGVGQKQTHKISGTVSAELQFDK